MKKIINIVWRILALLTIAFVIIMNGCHSDGGPTSSTYIPQYENVEEGTAYSSEYWASVAEDAFQVNIPSSGDFKISYTTDRGSSEVLLRLSRTALITVTLESDNIVQEVTLRKGTITVNSSQSIETYDDAEFTADESFGTLVLISGGANVMAQPTATPTPTPTVVPTANALPSTLPTPSANAKTVVALGDSITYGYGSSVGGYPVYLEVKLLEEGYDVDVVNEGIPGEEAPETDERFEDTVRGADAVLLMIGTNDIIDGDCQSGTCELVDHIESMIDKAGSLGIPIFVSTIIAATTTGYYNRINDDIESANQQIESLASSKGVRLVDNYEAIQDSGGDVLYSDQLHLTDAGYEIMANIWYRRIRGRF